MLENTERKDFPIWIVEATFKTQNGSCAKCGRTLEKGYVRDHKDGDKANIKPENLRLLCPECNRDVQGSDVKQKWKVHKDQEKRVLDAFNVLMDKVLSEESKIGGPIIERLEAVMMDSLKVSRSLNEINKEVEYPPASIKLGLKLMESEKLMESYLDGVKFGVELAAKNFAIKTDVDVDKVVVRKDNIPNVEGKKSQRSK